VVEKMLPAIFFDKAFQVCFQERKNMFFFTTNKKSSHFLQLEERKNEKILF